jgi:radical SAM protein with 4Fe4S-binding SPASM domain
MCWRANFSLKEKKNLIKTESKRLTIEEYKRLFADMPRSVRYVEIVGGGEPLLFPEIGELFKTIKQKKIIAKLITNGSLMSGKIIRDLINCSWDSVRISFHAGSKDVYTKVNGSNDFDKVIRNIKLLINKRGTTQYPRISMLFVMQRDNVYDIIKFARLAETLGVDEIEFATLTPTCDPRLLLTPEQRKGVIADLVKLKSELHIKHNIEYALKMFSEHPLWMNQKRGKKYYRNRYCQIVQSNIEISADGRVVPCCMAYDNYEYSNIRKKSLERIWRDAKTFRMEMARGKFRSFCYKICTYELSLKN